MKWIKKLVVELRIKKNKGRNVEKSQKSIEDIKSIHILADSYENLVSATAAVAKHWSSGVVIEGRYYDEERVDEQSFSPKNFNLIGIPDHDLQHFMDQKADIMLFTCSPTNAFMYLVAQNKSADYKIGFHHDLNDQLLDIMLAKEDSSLSSNIENLLKYLKKII
ncbi:hypothetical protein DN752_03350 [Echinicola strongylocentroti]|uniref:Uncharacterized protein n=1 Tax=Echinicola strongylocentroti TaxID=1795355 RepID=A0A2Z4IEC0_9BACT|nr:hypothetical protein [Echinicola strongylocentroti]AWW29254.1 hypothetical protein DN752_03350 [Echinicola strongylocentroti]